MANRDELRKLDKNAALARLKDYRDGLHALKNNPEVSQYAAEEYIDEALDKLDAAIVDVNRALEEDESE